MYQDPRCGGVRCGGIRGLLTYLFLTFPTPPGAVESTAPHGDISQRHQPDAVPIQVPCEQRMSGIISRPLPSGPSGISSRDNVSSHHCALDRRGEMAYWQDLETTIQKFGVRQSSTNHRITRHLAGTYPWQHDIVQESLQHEATRQCRLGPQCRPGPNNKS